MPIPYRRAGPLLADPPDPEELTVVDAQTPTSTDDRRAPGATGHYTLSPHLDVLVYSTDEVRLRQGTWSDHTLTLHDDERRGVLGTIFAELLVAPRSCDDLHALPGIAGRVSRDELADFLTDLVLSDALVAPGGVARAAARPVGPGRLDSALAAGPAAAAQDAATPVVAVVGDGPTAELAAAYLAEAGAAVEPPTMGRRSASDELVAAFSASGFVVVALESFSPTVLDTANSVALERRVPWVATYSDGPLVVVGPIYVPGDTGCYAEFEAQLVSVCSRRSETKAYWDTLASRTSPRRPPRWHGGLAAPLFVAQFYELVSAGSSDLVGRAIVFDLAQRRMETVRCLTLPRCPVCRHERGVHPWD